MLRSLSAAIFAIALLVHPDGAQADDLDHIRAQALALVNQSRQQHKLPPLSQEAKLTKAAQGHASDMLKRKYYAHSSPEGKTVSDRYKRVGGRNWLLTAENIAKFSNSPPPVSYNLLKHIQESWMNSPGHRKNILHPGLTEFGFGIAVDARGELYAVQNFAGPGLPIATGAVADAKPVGPHEQTTLALAAINAERKKAGRAALQSSDALAKAAQALLPAKGDKSFSIGKKNIWDIIPAQDGESWKSVSILNVACGGCGVQPVVDDVGYFTGQMAGEKKSRALLVNADFTHLGFAIGADGAGKKVAIGVVGQREGR
jgi:uncharacterized protein YkwD